MHAFINSPAMAKLVALQMVEEEVARSRRARKARPSRAERRALRASATAAKTLHSGRLAPPAWTRPAH
jgi:hypothetical protein